MARAEQSVIVREPETVAVFKSWLQKPICFVLTVHKQFFLYPECVSVQEKGRSFLKIAFDVDSQSQTNMLTLHCSLSVHT